MLRSEAIHLERRAEALPIARLVGFVIFFVTSFSLALVVLAS